MKGARKNTDDTEEMLLDRLPLVVTKAGFQGDEGSPGPLHTMELTGDGTPKEKKRRNSEIAKLSALTLPRDSTKHMDGGEPSEFSSVQTTLGQSGFA